MEAAAHADGCAAGAGAAERGSGIRDGGGGCAACARSAAHYTACFAFRTLCCVQSGRTNAPCLLTRWSALLLSFATAVSLGLNLSPEERALLLVAKPGSLLGPPECWNNVDDDNQTFKEMVVLDTFVQGDIMGLELRDRSELSGLMSKCAHGMGCCKGQPC